MNPSTPVTAIKDLRKNPDGSLSYTVEGSSVVYRAEDGVPGTPGSNVHAAILLAYELAEMRRQHEEHEASKLKAAEPAAPPHSHPRGNDRYPGEAVVVPSVPGRRYRCCKAEGPVHEGVRSETCHLGCLSNAGARASKG